jgi:peptidoglycan/LPS O-acetylase OafA/YrhL
MTTLEAAQQALPKRRVARPRIRILDGLRLVAALLVVSWHYAAFGHGASLTPYARVPELYPVAAYGWLGVELFFLISGFVICMSSIGHTLREFVTSRITRLFPAYWFGVALTTAVLLLWPVERSSIPLKDVFVNLTMMQSGFGIGSVDAVYWTLWAELHFYVLFALVVWRGVNYARVAAFCGAWLVAAYIGQQVGGELDLVLIADYAPFFIAGVAFFLMHHYGQKPLLWVYVAASFALGIRPVLRTLASSNNHLQEQIPQWPAVAAVALFFLLMAAVALRWLRAEWRWLGVAGAMTYPLYLIHEFIGWAILKSLDAEIPGPVLYLGTVALMLALAYLIHRYVERLLAPKLRTAVRAILAAPTKAWQALKSNPDSGVRGPDPTPVIQASFTLIEQREGRLDHDYRATSAGNKSMMSLSPGPVSSNVTGAPVAASTSRIRLATLDVIELEERDPRIDGS